MAAMEVDSAQKTHRKQATYVRLDEGFEIQNEMYRGQQYSQIYFVRLHLMRALLHSLVPNWRPDLPVCTVLGLETGKECIIIGTLYKHMKLKPCILDEYSKERSATPLVKPRNFVQPDDYLILEDESGRVKLGGAILSPSLFVTGVVAAMRGRETGSDDFIVEEVLEAGLPPQIERPITSSISVPERVDELKLGTDQSKPEESKAKGVVYPFEMAEETNAIFDDEEDKYVLFVSGLRVGANNSNPLQLQLLVDHITGHLGDEEEQQVAAGIVRIVIAGNSVEIPKGLLNGQNLAPKDLPRLSNPIKELDISLTQVASGVPLDIMPGSGDPANFALPQQPLNRCLFPGSAVYNTFTSCTNPHCFEVDGIRFLGTSGQNIDDLAKYSEAKDQIEFMGRTLKWRHLAPTTPNTLGCYPFTDRGPFVIESCPHVYFAGNQDEYKTCLLDGPEGQLVRVICIPRFCETGVAVMLNLRDLECHTVTFETEFS